MRISHIRNDDTLSYSVKAPITFLDQADRSFEIEEWSLDSVVRTEELARKEYVGELFLYFQGFSIYFPVTLEPGEEEERLYFKDLDTRQEEIIRLFYNGIRTGEMVPFDNVIKSMDVPVRKVSLDQTAEDRKFEGEPKSRFARIGGALAVLATLAFVVFGSLGYSLWQRLSFIETYNASVVSGNDDALLVQAWVPDPDVTKTWVGMPASVAINIGGSERVIPALISETSSGSEKGPARDDGYLVRLTIEDGAEIPEEFQIGRPVDVRLKRGFLGGG